MSYISKNIYFFFFFFGFCISLSSTAIFHPLCNCEQGNETPPFLRNIYYLHAFSNFQQSQFLLEWIRWFPFLMYQLACILICLTPFSDSLWKLTSHYSFLYPLLMLKSIWSFSFNHLFTFSNRHTGEEVIFKHLDRTPLVPLIPGAQEMARLVRASLFTETGVVLHKFLSIQYTHSTSTTLRGVHQKDGKVY